jgi:prenyltransferase beta subunit
MLQVARLCPRVLGESTELVARFLHAQRSAQGAFVDRSGRPDLYYTVFGLDALIAIHEEPTASVVEPFLRTFGDGDGLDFVHLACLARAWATVSRQPPSDIATPLLAKLETFRTADGGYNAAPGAEWGTAYAAFLALGAYQDLKGALPRPEALLQSLRGLESADGAYANRPHMTHGQTSATAAAIAVRRQLDAPISDTIAEWLLERVHPQGGFTAAPAVPAPDLLSTATALHALATLQRPLEESVREACLDFVDSLWTSRGGFYGHWADDHVDCEYTYYGLLSLGHLAT